MKKFIYLSLTGLMVLSPKTNCMEEIITADKEAGSQTVEALPSKEELVQRFMGAALVVSTLERENVATTEEFSTMGKLYKIIKAMNNGSKEQTKIDLHDGYCSEDEEYYTSKIEDADLTVHKIRTVDFMLAMKNQPRLTRNEKRSEQLAQQQEELDKSYIELLNRRAKVKEERTQVAAEKAVLDQAHTILTNTKEKENSLLSRRKEKLTAQLKALDERIKQKKEETSALLDKEVSESLLISEVAETSEAKEKLVKEQELLQGELTKVEAAIKSLEPKTSWWK